jgi:hypothetical protein
MRSKILVALIAVAVMGVSTATMAKGGGGGKGGSGGHVGHAPFGHAPFHARFDRRFLRNQFLLGGWGWGLGWPYYDSGYGNNTVVVAYPQATPQAANVTGSIATAPCHWNEDTFTVPSSAGGTRPIAVVSCR